MILICRNCLRIGLGNYDKELVYTSAPVVRRAAILVGIASKQRCVQLSLSVLRIFEVLLDVLIYGLSHEDSCHKCGGSRSMVYVYSEEGEQLIIDNDINFPLEDVTITVHDPK